MPINKVTRLKDNYLAENRIFYLSSLVLGSSITINELLKPNKPVGFLLYTNKTIKTIRFSVCFQTQGIILSKFPV